MNDQTILGVALTSLLLAAGCVSDPASNSPTSGATSGTGASAGSGGSTTSSGSGGAGGSGGATQQTGYVFTMSNATDINELVVFERGVDGALSARESVPTGGLGSGDGLGSQGALVTSPDGNYLYVVNAGSDQISSFRIYDDHLALVDLVSSGGQRPISLTASDDRVYVVNAGGDGGVQGFSADGGVLTPIVGGAQPLSTVGASGPAQVGLAPSGAALIVTEKATNSLLTYWVAPDGSLSQPTVTASAGDTPFGFDFAPNGDLIVSEAFGGADGMSAASSYAIGSVEPTPISSSVPSGQSAACWMLLAQGTFAYTTNTKSNTISGYDVASDGTLSLFPDDGETVYLGADQSPLDMALAGEDHFLYVLNGKSDRLVGFTIASDGSLVEMAQDMTVPAAGVGLAAR